MRRTLLRLIVMLMAFTATVAMAVERPLWEVGVGVAAISFPHYRGSDERNDWLLPAPYFVYRGKVLRADERRIRGLLYESERVDMDVSINGTPPVKSSGSDARRGMPDLDATLELGPSVNFTLLRMREGRGTLGLRLPLRAVVASDLKTVERVGWLFQPQISADVRNVLRQSGWNLGLQFGPLFSDRHYNRHFYGVDPVYALPGRPSYEANGGYGGLQSIVALSKRFPGYWVGGFAKWDSLASATYADSPLVRTRQHLSVGVAVAWILGRSSTLVDRKE
jgi:outer membrane scaffolding protein for murein synthesis (MipA/OmpV family)